MSFIKNLSLGERYIYIQNKYEEKYISDVLYDYLLIAKSVFYIDTESIQIYFVNALMEKVYEKYRDDIKNFVKENFR